jgi:hypothetical protein
MTNTYDPCRYVTDESRWPIVQITCPRMAPDLAAVERYAAFLDGVLARRLPYCLILDAREAGPLDARGRDRIRQQRTSSMHLRERYQLGAAHVADTALERAIIRAILAASPGDSPERLCETLAEAEQWVSGRLASRRAGVTA